MLFIFSDQSSSLHTIEMHYQPEVEKVAMMNVPNMVAPIPLLLTENPEVQRTRKILLIILGVCLVSYPFH